MTGIAEAFYTKRGLLYLPRGDEWIGPSFRAGQYWEENILEAMLAKLPDDGKGVYVDAGSFVGTHAVPMAQKAAVVLAFEPQRHIFQMLCTNAVTNGVSNLHAFNTALGHIDHTLISMNGTVPDGVSKGQKLAFGGPSRAGPINFGGTNIGAGGDTAEMRTLDSIFEQLGQRVQGCDVLKVDVQGAEPLMFYGARGVIAKHRPSIFYEIDPRFGITPDMHAQMTIPLEVASFNIEAYAHSLGYGPPTQLGPCDWLLARPSN